MCCCFIWLKIAVFAAAGVTQLTRTPARANSFPSDLVSAITPAFEALYATALGLPSLPAIDAMLTMRPYLRFTMWGATARQHRNWLVRFTRSTRSHSSNGYSTTGELSPAIPALLTRTSIVPSSATTFAVAFSTCAGSEKVVAELGTIDVL